MAHAARRVSWFGFRRVDKTCRISKKWGQTQKNGVQKNGVRLDFLRRMEKWGQTQGQRRSSISSRCCRWWAGLVLALVAYLVIEQHRRSRRVIAGPRVNGDRVNGDRPCKNAERALPQARVNFYIRVTAFFLVAGLRESDSRPASRKSQSTKSETSGFPDDVLEVRT